MYLYCFIIYIFLNGLKNFRYKINDIYDILEQIETEKKREKDFKEQKKILGELFTNVRAALLNINMMLLCMKHSTKGAKKLLKDGNKTGLKESIIMIDREDAEERDMLLELEGIDTDGKKKYIIFYERKININSFFSHILFLFLEISSYR